MSTHLLIVSLPLVSCSLHYFLPAVPLVRCCVSSCFYPFIWVIRCCLTGLLCGWGGARQVFVLMLHPWPALKIVLPGFVFIAHPAADPSMHLASFLLHCESYYLTRSAYISCVNQICVYLVWWSASWMADEYSVMSAMLCTKRFTFFYGVFPRGNYCSEN